MHPAVRIELRHRRIDDRISRAPLAPCAKIIVRVAPLQPFRLREERRAGDVRKTCKHLLIEIAPDQFVDPRLDAGALRAARRERLRDARPDPDRPGAQMRRETGGPVQRRKVAPRSVRGDIAVEERAQDGVRARLAAAGIRRGARMTVGLRRGNLERRPELAPREQPPRERVFRVDRRMRMRAESLPPATLVRGEHRVRFAAVLHDLRRIEVDMIDEGRDGQTGRFEHVAHVRVATNRLRIVVGVEIQCVRADALREGKELGRKVAFEQRELAAAFSQVGADLVQRREEELDDRGTDAFASQELRIEHEDGRDLARRVRRRAERDVIVQAKVATKPDHGATMLHTTLFSGDAREYARGRGRGAEKTVAMELHLDRLDLPLAHPFTITRGTVRTAHTALVRLRHDGIEGLGEGSPVARYGEDVAGTLAALRARALGDDPYALEALLPGLPPAARCALDVALHDWVGKDLDRPLYRLLGLDPARTPLTSFTVGIDAPETMLAKVDAVRDHPILKVKLGAGDDVAIVEAIRARYTGTLRVDANEGWTAEEAVRNLRDMARFEIEFCEQPIPAGTPEQLRYVREATSIPIVADEDARTASDVGALIGCVDGINVKLVKCGGIRGALAMIHTARALGMRIMLGCMVESSVLSTAAAHLSPLVDWADLDGPFLIGADPFRGVTYVNGKLMLPTGPGLGVTSRS